jgi:two-component system, cell cycle response regulator
VKRNPVLRRLVTEGMFPLVLVVASLGYIARLFSLDQLGMTWSSVILVALIAALGVKATLLLSGRRAFGGDIVMGLLIVLAMKALGQLLSVGVCAPGDATCAGSIQSIEFLAFAFLALSHHPAWMGAMAVYAAAIDLGNAAGPAALYLAAEPELVFAALPGVAGRFALNLAFGVGFGYFIRTERESRAYAVDELQRLEREAQSFHLQTLVANPDQGLEAMSRAGREEAEKRAVQRLRQKESEIARFVKRTMKCYSAAIFRYDPLGEKLELRAWATDSRHVKSSVSIKPGEGVIGWIFRERDALPLGESTRPLADLPYYDAADEGIYSFLGVPILDGDRCIGVIVVDSREFAAFGEEHRTSLEVAARMVFDAVQNEELRSRQETEALQLQAMLELSRQVSEGLDVSDICKRVILSVFKIVPYRLAAVALWDDAAAQFSIEYGARVDGVPVEAADWLGTAFGEEPETILSYAMRQEGPYLIENYLRREKSKRLPILAPELKVPDVDSILAVPLTHGGLRVGCLVLGVEGSGVFEETERKLFGILANLFASSLLNASKHRETSALATTDALTGLANRIKYKEFFVAQVAMARRTKEPLSLLLMDIDHFKKINDTYGHPAGDAVLKRLAEILKEQSRETDLPVRFGGEEFLAVLPNTSRRDATRAAERVRKAVEKCVFTLPDGRTIRITMSLGAATFPEDCSREDELAEKADQALYSAKSGGRNRVQQFSDLPKSKGDGTTSWVGRKDDTDDDPNGAGGTATGSATAARTKGGATSVSSGGKTWRFGS